MCLFDFKIISYKLTVLKYITGRSTLQYLYLLESCWFGIRCFTVWLIYEIIS